MKIAGFPIVAAALLGLLPHEANAQKSEVIDPASGLYFGCKAAPVADPAKLRELALVYFDLKGSPGFQLQLRDPSDWMPGTHDSTPKPRFLLARRTSNEKLFLWLGRPVASSSGEVDATIELTPVQGRSGRATIWATRFISAAGGVSAETITGECEMLLGKAAWDLFQRKLVK